MENTVLANQATELQQQLEIKDETISFLLIYRQNLEDNFEAIHDKLVLLDQEVKTIYIPMQEGICPHVTDIMTLLYLFTPDVEM